MIHAICSLREGDCALLPHWISHYRALGVDKIHVTMDVRTCPWSEFEQYKHALDSAYYHISPTGLSDPDGYYDMQEENALKEVNPEAWVLRIDLDEFHEYPASLKDIVKAMESRNEWAVHGHFRD